jgi:hypothetical protein
MQRSKSPLSSTPITFSEESGCSTTPLSSTMKPNQVCLEDLPETLPVTREDEENSIQSLESSSEESSSTSTVLSTGSYSTVLESDDSSESSLFSDDYFSRYERTVSSNISLKSVKLRKSFERRENELRRLSLGKKGYRIYLSRQEELVQQHFYNRLSRDPKISPSNRPITDENFVETGFIFPVQLLQTSVHNIGGCCWNLPPSFNWIDLELGGCQFVRRS